MTQQIFTVSELNNQIKNMIESGFSSVSVKGEISELNMHISGHMYFSVKDSLSMLKCVLFNYNSKLNNYSPKKGDEIIIKGKSSLYTKNGSFQFYANSISLAGQGNLWLQFEQLKKKLLDEGLFKKEHKKLLPEYPKKIALITSLSGSVIKDIMDVINRNSPYLKVLVRDCRMQGEEAVQDLIESIDDIHNSNINVDAIIIARGGGSLEDLWCFNNEKLAYKIFDSLIPIVSAIGHETDTSISDLVSDIRAGTPSIAAEIIAPSVNDCHQIIDGLQTDAFNLIKNQIEKYFILLNNINKRHGLHKIKYVLLNHYDKFNRIEKNINVINLKKAIELKNNQLVLVLKSTNNRFKYFIQKNNDKVKYLQKHINSLSPKNIMKRGYSIVYNKNNKVIRSAEDIKDKEKLDIKLYTGKIEVQNLKPTKKIGE